MIRPDNSTFAFLADRGRAIREDAGRLTGGTEEPISAGDVFVLEMPDPLPLWWTAVATHTDDDELWRMVPGDTLHLLGPADVRIEHHSHLPDLTFRPSCAVWVHRSDIDPEGRLSRLDRGDVETLYRAICHINAEPFATPVESDGDDSWDPDLADWLDTLRAGVESLERSLHDAPETVTVVSGPDWQVATMDESFQLAAATVDSDDTTGDDVQLLRDTLRLRETVGGGRLWVRLYDDGLVVEWHTDVDSDEDPPAVVCREQTQRWFGGGNGPSSTGLIDWSDDNVRLESGGQTFEIPRPGPDEDSVDESQGRTFRGE